MALELCLPKRDSCQDCERKEYCLIYNFSKCFYDLGYRKVIQGEWVKNEINGEDYGQIYYQHKNCKVNETQLFPSPYKY